jgi:rhomboid protease GluP
MSFEPSRGTGPTDPRPPEPQAQLRADVVQVPLRLPSSRPVVTYTLLGLTILVFVAQQLSVALLGGDYPAAIGLKNNARIIAGEYWRFLTPMLLHGSIMHILFNMYALYSFGRGLERIYGHTRYLLLYLMGALAGNVASFILSPNNSLGASTAVFGLVAAEGVSIYLNRRILGNQARNILANVGFVIVVNLILGFSSTGIDNWGHLGGLFGGGVFALLAGPLFVVEGYYPDLRLTDRRSGMLPYLVALVEAAAVFMLASFGLR